MLIIAVNVLNLLVNLAVGLIVASFLGPETFGRFAVAIGAGGLAQMLVFGWLRSAAARFYSEEVRAQRPELRATLDRALLVASVVTIGIGVVAGAAGAGPLDPALTVVTMTFAALNGAFEYQLALLRARFHDRGYAVLVLVKNGLSLALTAGLAYATGSAVLTLAGTAASVGLSALILRAAIADAGAREAGPRASILRESLAYGLPLSASLVLFALIPLVNRAVGAATGGFADAGQLSLAQDIGLRLVLAIGLSLDALLFQIAVRADETQGAAQGRGQIADNMAIMAAVLLPALAGVWLVLPSFQVLIVPEAYRGAFGEALTLLLPGLACYGLMVFALSPAFQIARRTWPVIAAAAVACAADGLILLVMRPLDVATLAVAQTGSLAAGLGALALLSRVARPQWPRLRDAAGIVGATLVMTAGVLPLRDMTPGLTALLAQAALGAAIYAGLTLALDLAGLRGVAARVWRDARTGLQRRVGDRQAS